MPEDRAGAGADTETNDAGEVHGEPILPVTSIANLAPDKVELGRKLFHDAALSSMERRVSCATCHPLDQAGTRGSIEEAAGNDQWDQYDIPTIFNTAHNFAYFWNGRARHLESVVQSSIRSESVMDASWPDLLERLRAGGEYGSRFEDVYPEWGLSEAAVEDALATFVRSLSTPNATFDRWLNGEALPDRAREGYALFKRYGCVRCHQGSGAGGNLYASFEGYVARKENIRTPDYGRFNVTSNEEHRYQFKVPSLRNVAVTAPYFHDGGVADLDDAVEAMALHQLGRDLTANETDLIVAFLESLTGWYDGRLLGTGSEGETP